MPDNGDLNRNLVAQASQLDEIEERVRVLRAAISDGADVRAETLEPLVVPAPSSYDDITTANLRYLQDAGRTDVQLEDLIDARDLALLRLDSDRLRWSQSDVLTVGLVGLVGSICSVFEETIDATVVNELGVLEKTELIQRWKRETGNLPIDYSGAYSGGTAHRVTSAGHDIGRPIEAIQQIIDGEYRGTGWVFGQKESLVRLGNVRGTPYDVTSPGLALALWVKHLVTDVVTPTSLPLPGWTKLFELAPTRDLAKFFQDMYWTRSGGPGWNIRTVGVTKAVPLVTVEVGIRMKLAWDAYAERGELRLTERERSKQDEMLLAGNGVVALVSTGHAVIGCLTTNSPLGLRALNPGVLVRTGHLGVQVYREHRERDAASPPTWDELARTSIAADEARLGRYVI